MLTPQSSTLDEMIESLSDEQEELLLILMRDISKFLHEQGQSSMVTGVRKNTQF